MEQRYLSVIQHHATAKEVFEAVEVNPIAIISSSENPSEWVAVDTSDGKNLKLRNERGECITRPLVGKELFLSRTLASALFQLQVNEKAFLELEAKVEAAESALKELEEIHGLLDEEQIPRHSDIPEISDVSYPLWVRIQKYALPRRVRITPEELLRLPVQVHEDNSTSVLDNALTHFVGDTITAEEKASEKLDIAKTLIEGLSNKGTVK